MFRRRLLKRTAVFLAGSLAFPYVSQIYPPLDLDLMLVFFGALFFFALAIAVVLDVGREIAGNSKCSKRVYSDFIPLPWILAAALLLNGKLTRKKNVAYHATTVDSRYNMPESSAARADCCHSCAKGQKIERLAVDFDDYDRFARRLW